MIDIDLISGVLNCLGVDESDLWALLLVVCVLAVACALFVEFGLGPEVAP